MLLRFDPFRDFERMTESRTPLARTLPMDAYRRGNHVIAHLDLPGVRPDDVDISVERNVLTVRAVRHFEEAEDDERIIGERRHGEFARQLLLGETLDANRIDADFTDGVLTLRVPIAETAKPRKVEISTGGSGQSALSA